MSTKPRKTAKPKSAPRSKKAPEELTEKPQLNARFEAQLPQIIEEISRVLNVTRPEIEDAAISVAELHDYLNFEIQKTSLKIEQLKWETRVDPGEKQRTQAWLDELIALRETFPSDGLAASVAFLENLKAAVRRVLLDETDEIEK